MDNNIKTLSISIFLLTVLVSCGAPKPTPYPAEQQSNFAVRFEYGSCTTDILDTFNDTYTRDMIVEPDVTIPLSVSDSEMATIIKRWWKSDFEINEAFAAQYLAVEKAMGLDRQVTNVNGSGISLGHPVGATGCRIVVTLLHEMMKRKSNFGLAGLCGGGGVGMALLLKRI